MKKYPKIPAIWQRDEQTHKLIYGAYRNPIVRYLENCYWVFTEKIDGTNIRIIWDGYSFEIEGRTNNTQIPQPIQDWFAATFLNNEMHELFEQKFESKEVVLYGKRYGGKIHKQSIPYQENESFILFDVMIDGFFLEIDNMLDIAKTLGLRVAPRVINGSIQKALDFMKTKPVSMLNGETPMEGIIGKPFHEICDRTGERIIVKIKPHDVDLSLDE